MLDFIRWKKEEIAWTYKAIEKFTVELGMDERFINEFSDIDPSVAQIYRDWKAFHEEKLTHFRERLVKLQAELEKLEPLPSVQPW